MQTKMTTTKLPSLHSKTTLASPGKHQSGPSYRAVTNSPKTSHAPTSYIINMDAAKHSNKRSQKSRAAGAVTAEEALKKYYDKMTALDKRLKHEMEIQRLKRQGLGPEEDQDSDENNAMSRQ